MRPCVVMKRTTTGKIYLSFAARASWQNRNRISALWLSAYPYLAFIAKIEESLKVCPCRASKKHKTLFVVQDEISVSGSMPPPVSTANQSSASCWAALAIDSSNFGTSGGMPGWYNQASQSIVLISSLSLKNVMKKSLKSSDVRVLYAKVLMYAWKNASKSGVPTLFSNA